MSAPPCGAPLLLAGLIGLTLASAPSAAQAMEAGPVRLRLTTAQQKKLFPDWRQLSLQTTRSRIAIQQRHERCISAAGSMQALRTCQQQQHQALLNLRQQQSEALRQLLQRNGITPTARQGAGTPQPQQPDGLPMI